MGDLTFKLKGWQRKKRKNGQDKRVQKAFKHES